MIIDLPIFEKPDLSGKPEGQEENDGEDFADEFFNDEDFEEEEEENVNSNENCK
jgi:hypothetical protein